MPESLDDERSKSLGIRFMFSHPDMGNGTGLYHRMQHTLPGYFVDRVLYQFVVEVGTVCVVYFACIETAFDILAGNIGIGP